MSGINLKNVIFAAILFIAGIVFVKSCSNKENYRKERKEINSNIKMLENKFDSLEKESNKLKQDYNKYQLSYIKDSLLIDSLGSEIDEQIVRANKMENKAKFYLGKYSDITKKINKLESNKDYKTGDTLLRSLGQKIK
jgi:chromosome segregation ATPase